MIEAMRDEARARFALAVGAADPEVAVRRSLAEAPVRAARIWLVAVGKAGRSMAAAALSLLKDPVAGTIVVTNAGNAAPLDGARVLEAGHPVPDAAGLRAGEAVLAMLSQTRPGDLVLALISGGGSALLPAPVAGVTLRDKAEASRIMLAAGLDITAMNSVRQHLSRIKGGGLRRAAAPARVVALILSDVIGDDLRVIASGPTVAPVASPAEVRQMLRAHGLWARMPLSVREALERAGSGAEGGDEERGGAKGGGAEGGDEERGGAKGGGAEGVLPDAENRLIGSNAKSVQAMVAGGDGEIWDPALCGDVAEAANALVTRMRAARPGRVLAFCGGETTVVVHGSGRGGRNQEMALRVAAGMEGVARPWVFLSGGTDGRDGPTEAAGGLVDGGTLARIAAAGGDWRALLADNDSNRALRLADDLLVTGATGTNVADVQIIVMG